jgi:peptidoglycan/LPS O-acetylase OafA/YrhL
MTAAPGVIVLVAVLGLVYYRRARFFTRLAREAHENHGAKGLAVVGAVAAAFLAFTAFKLHLTPSGYQHYRLAMLGVGLLFALLIGAVALRMRRPAKERESEPKPARGPRTYSIPVWFLAALCGSGLLLLVGLMRELGGSVMPGAVLVLLALALGVLCVVGLKRARVSADWPGLFTPPAQS